MQITTTIALAPGDSLSLTPDEAASAILQALAVDPVKDSVFVTLVQAAERGAAGAPETGPLWHG